MAKLIIQETDNGFTVEAQGKIDGFTRKLHTFFELIEKKAKKRGLPVEVKRIKAPIEISSQELQDFDWGMRTIEKEIL